MKIIANKLADIVLDIVETNYVRYGYKIDIYWDYDDEHKITAFYSNWGGYGKKNEEQTYQFAMTLLETANAVRRLNSRFIGYEITYEED